LKWTAAGSRGVRSVQNYPFNEHRLHPALCFRPTLPSDLFRSDPAMTFGIAVGGR